MNIWEGNVLGGNSLGRKRFGEETSGNRIKLVIFKILPTFFESKLELHVHIMHIHHHTLSCNYSGEEVTKKYSTCTHAHNCSQPVAFQASTMQQS